MLGDPWILARTISDAQDGTDDSIVNESGGSDLWCLRRRDRQTGHAFSGIEISVVEDRADHSGCDPWNCSGYFCDYGTHPTSAPVLVPILIVCLIVAVFQGKTLIEISKDRWGADRLLREYK